MKSIAFLSVLLLSAFQLNAQDPSVIIKKLDDEKATYYQMAETIWKWAEPGYLESKTTSPVSYTHLTLPTKRIV